MDLDKTTRDSIKSGLKSVINDHGPLTKTLIGSALKRIEAVLKQKSEQISKRLTQK